MFKPHTMGKTFNSPKSFLQSPHDASLLDTFCHNKQVKGILYDQDIKRYTFM